MSEPLLENAFDAVFDTHVAGCPVDGTRWSYLNKNELVLNLVKKGFKVGRHVVTRFLTKAGLGLRKMAKVRTMKENIAGRNEQFERIAELKKRYLANNWPVFSIDVKKKELLGRFARSGQVLCDKAVGSNDHDFASMSLGVVVPWGLHDSGLNEGYIILGQSDDTAEFNAACFRQYWEMYGSKIYCKKDPILILVDGGGSNASANRLFKQEMQGIADELGCEIRIAHYPPYCSKYNPIEHKLFPLITKAWSGVMLDSVDTMCTLVKERCQNWKSELKVNIDKIDKSFKKGVRVYDDYMDYLDITFDEVNKKLNYMFRPLDT